MKTEDVEELLRGVIKDNLSKTCWTISAEHLTELVNRAIETKLKEQDWYGQHQWQCGYERGWDAAMEQKEKNT